MSLIRTAVWPAIFLAINTFAAEAQDVTLTSRDESVVINGVLVGYDGEFYRVATEFGVLTLDGSGVICTGPGCPDLTDFVAKLRLAGAYSVGASLMPPLFQSFAAQNGYLISSINSEPNLTTYVFSDPATDRVVAEFDVERSDSDRGIAALLSESADVALSLRGATADEVLAGEQAGLGNLNALAQARVLALDGLVPVVSPMNTIDYISPTDLYRIVAGEISNWQDLGGIDAPIVLHLPSETLGIGQLFESYLAQSKFNAGADIIRHAAIPDMLTAVARDPFALAVSVNSTAVGTKRLQLQGECGFLSIAEPEALKTEDYPLTAPVFAFFPARRLPAVAREFFRYLRSDEAQQVVQDTGFANQLLSQTPVAAQGNRLANAVATVGEDVQLSDLQRMVSTLKSYKRLSISFRFEGGASTLDAQSRSNIVLLAREIEAGRFDGHELMFAGFSDGEGPAAANLRLSRLRALSVKSAVMAEAATADLSQISTVVDAFGEAMPMACDDTEWGRKVNRRVEVWIR